MCIRLLKDEYGDNLMSRSRVFELHKNLVRVGRKWKMINIQVPLRLRKATKKFRKSDKFFSKIDVWVWEWLQTLWVLTETQCDKFFGRNGWIFGRTKSGCCIRTMPQLTTPFCSSSFLPINAFEYLNILHIRGFSTLWLFSVHQSEKWREPIFHQLKSWRHKRHSYWTACGLKSYSTALNNGGQECSGV